VVYECQPPVRRAVTFCLQLQKVTKKSRGCAWCLKARSKAWFVQIAPAKADISVNGGSGGLDSVDCKKIYNSGLMIFNVKKGLKMLCSSLQLVQH